MKTVRRVVRAWYVCVCGGGVPGSHDTGIVRKLQEIARFQGNGREGVGGTLTLSR